MTTVGVVTTWQPNGVACPVCGCHATGPDKAFLRKIHDGMHASFLAEQPEQELTLTEFLLDRISEDEAVAEATAHHSLRTRSPHWFVGYTPDELEVEDTDPDASGIVDGDHEIVVYDEGRPDAAQAAHIARHDPARVLAECKAKRAIVEAHPLVTDSARLVAVWSGSTPGVACETCGGDPANESVPLEDIGPCATLCALAAVYADHPDYRESWRV